jgi:hypothetical protein
VDGAYKTWQLGVKSSSARETMSALNQFGLVDYEGRGPGRKVKLSDLAQKILLDVRPVSPERDGFIRTAALNPKIHADLWAEYGKDLPPDDYAIITFLARDKDYNEKAARDLTAEYRDTLLFAKLGEPGIIPPEPEQNGDSGKAAVKVGDYVQWESLGVLQFPEPRRVIRLDSTAGFLWVEGSDTGIPMNQAQQVAAPKPPAAPLPPVAPGAESALQPLIQEERIIDDAGSPIVIRFSGDIKQMYDFLEAYIRFRKDRQTTKGQRANQSQEQEKPA